MSVKQFEGLLPHHLYAQSLKVEASKSKWYKLSRDALLHYVYYDEVARVAKNATDIYEHQTPHLEERTTLGVQSVINEELKKVTKKHNSKFRKLLAIANPELGVEFLNKIKKHYDTHTDPEMSQEKIHKLMLSQEDSSLKKSGG